MEINGQQLEATGRVIAVLPVQTGTNARGNAWAIQTAVIEYSEPTAQYPRRMAFDLYGEDKIKMDGPKLVMGNIVKVYFNIDARESQNHDRWFTSIRAWRVDNAGQPMPQGQPQ